ncbi:conserved hypothetical protein [Theileria equi strain WA]|uniref:C3H1-type domain-containing protein n=1 Tax=Theileria equi strain WA TaxID=1537102 RepID=L1LF13_THEEQ|nr:conserved hypothetical protein [Theileria equi strain WA]EKX74032.1 conserved hypothetical protein [Theileria equi strain WA]|eukprot:XP_004833484.1 conserved hypothetical protein [Theileria equi strain WA]
MNDSIPVTRTFDPSKPNPFISNKFKRRCPIAYFYMPIECSLARSCNNGFCPLSHTKLEVIFHPILHKTKRCSMALMNVCNFSQRCAFYHSQSDKMGAQLSWLVWQKKWEVWENNFDSILANYNIGEDIRKKLHVMITPRFNSQNPPGKVVCDDNDCIFDIEKQLNALLDSCDTPDTIASQPTTDLSSGLSPSSKFISSFSQMYNFESHYE